MRLDLRALVETVEASRPAPDVRRAAFRSIARGFIWEHLGGCDCSEGTWEMMYLDRETCRFHRQDGLRRISAILGRYLRTGSEKAVSRLMTDDRTWVRQVAMEAVGRYPITDTEDRTESPGKGRGR